MKLHTFINKFLLAHKGVYSPDTVKWYENRFKPLLSDLGGRRISQITVDDLRELYVSLSEVKATYRNHPHPGRRPGKKGYSRYSLFNFARAWKRLFNWAKEEGILDTNPGEWLKLPRLPKPDP